MRKTLLPFVLLLAALAGANAQSFTGTYTFTGTTGTNNPFAYNGTDIANLTEGGLSRSNLPVSSISGNFRSTGFALDLVTNSLTGSYDPTKFFQFSLTADSGFTLSMSNITFGLGRSGTGPRSWAWASSVDNFAAFTGNYSSLGASAYFSTNISATNPAGALYFLTDQTGSAGTNIVLDLSGASFQNLTSITFRLYGWNSEGTAGTGGLQGPLFFSGSLLNTNPVTGGTYWAAATAGGGSGTWTSAGTTWATNTGGAGSGQTQSGATLVFADTAGTVTVSGGVTVSNGMTFQTTGYDVQSSAITLAGASAANNALTTDAGVTTTISSALAGTTGVTKSGSGTLILSGANTFSGNAVISAGTLQIAADSAIGNTANDLQNNGTLRTTTNVSLDVGRDISGSGTFDIANGTTLTVNGNINNTATTLANAGTLDLQGGTTRSLGSITLNAAGTINAVGAINATGLTASGLTNGTATISTNLNFTAGDKTVNVGAGGTLVVAGAVNLATSGTTELTKTGDGVLHLSGSGSSISRIQVGLAGASPTAGGTLRVSDVSSLGAQEIYLNSGTLQSTTNLATTLGISIAGRTNGAAVIGGVGGNGDLTFNGPARFFRQSSTDGELRLDVNNTTTFSGGIGGTTGGGTATGITIGGNGTLVIGGTNANFNDSLTLVSTLTAVRLTSADALAAATIVGGADKLQFATNTITLAGVTGAQNLNLETSGLGPQGVALTFNSSGSTTNTGIISGLGSFNKAGSGTVVLGGNNTYSGTTTVTAGSLVVNGNQSAATGSISVASGAKLGGSGTLGGAVSVLGTLAPGSSIESLSMGALSFSNGSTFAVELNSSVASSAGADLAVASGGLSLGGTVTLSLADIAVSPVAFAEGTKFTLINYSGGWNNGLFTFGSGTLLDGAVFAVGLNTWQIDYNATSGGANFNTEYLPLSNFVNIEAIPEPSTYALLVVSALGFASHLIRRRRR